MSSGIPIFLSVCRYTDSMNTHRTDEKKPTKVGSDVLAKIRHSIVKVRSDYARVRQKMDALGIQHADNVDRALLEVIEKLGL